MDKDYTELKKEALEIIKEQGNTINVAIHLYIITENIINGTFRDFDEEDDRKAQMLVGEAVSFYDIMKDNFTEELGDEFDLWVFVETATATILRKMKIDEDDSVMREVTSNAVACTFQAWKMNLTSTEFVSYFNEGNTSLPCAYNRKKVYAWAVENGITCSETQGLGDYAKFLKENMTAEEEIFAYHTLDEMCKAFDNGRLVFTNHGMSDEFIDKHHKLCRHLFMSAVSWYHFQPLMITFSDLCDDTEEAEEKAYHLFNDFLDSVEADGLDELIYFNEEKFFEEHPDATIEDEEYINADNEAALAWNEVYSLWFVTICMCDQLEPMGGFLGMKRGELINHAIKHSAK